MTIALPERPRILVVTLRRLGDVLLTTPLIRALKQGLPGAHVDALVFRGTEGILAGNPDLDHILTVSQRPGLRETVALIRRLWRRYDLAVATQTGDRPTFLAFAAGRQAIGLVAPGRGRWKQKLLTEAVASVPDSHRVVELLRLAEALGVSGRPDLVCPRRDEHTATVVAARPYAVLHVAPMFRYRRWTDDGWRALAAALAQRGLAVVVTGGPGPDERAYLDRVWAAAETPVIRLEGQLDWPQLTELIQRAAVFVGPETSVTHLAAGTGCATVAIHGPVDPRLIGPWPVGGLDPVWQQRGTIQHRGNVWVVQNPQLPCLPCERLGCEGHLDSRARCLDELTVDQVLRAVDMALGPGTSERRFFKQ